jgi:hypothetical protein
MGPEDEFVLLNRSCECLLCGPDPSKNRILFKHLIAKTKRKTNKWKFDGTFHKRFIQQHIAVTRAQATKKRLSFII